MALGFGGGGTASISELLAKKNYVKAIEAIRAQLKAGKKNPQLHNQLADVLVLAGKEKEAIQILIRLADEYASDGWEAKAIAVLKKIDRLEPGRRDVQAKLSSLVRDKRASAPSLPVTPRSETLPVVRWTADFTCCPTTRWTPCWHRALTRRQSARPTPSSSVTPPMP